MIKIIDYLEKIDHNPALSDLNDKLTVVESALKGEIRQELSQMHSVTQTLESRLANTVESLKNLNVKVQEESQLQAQLLISSPLRPVIDVNDSQFETSFIHNQDQRANDATECLVDVSSITEAAAIKNKDILNEHLVISIQGQILERVENILSQERSDLNSKLSKKVDSQVLEELVKHLATRDELKKMAKKKFNKSVDSNYVEEIVEKKMIEHRLSIAEQRSEYEVKDEPSKILSSSLNQLKQELKSFVSKNMDKLEQSLLKKVDKKVFQSQNEKENVFNVSFTDRNELKTWTREYIQKLVEEKSLELDQNYQTFISNQLKRIESNFKGSFIPNKNASPEIVSEEEMSLISRKLTRDFDEKLYLICSDLSSCKALISSQLAQPFHRCGQWLWKSGHLKMGSAIPWNIQTMNTGMSSPIDSYCKIINRARQFQMGTRSSEFKNCRCRII